MSNPNRRQPLDRFSVATVTTIDTSSTPPSPPPFDSSPPSPSTLPLERPPPRTRTDPHAPPPSPGTARLPHFPPNPLPALRRAHTRLVTEDYHNMTRSINDSLRPAGAPIPNPQPQQQPQQQPQPQSQPQQRPRLTPKDSGDGNPLATLHRLKSTSELYAEAQKEMVDAPPSSYNSRGGKRVTSGMWFGGRGGEASERGESSRQGASSGQGGSSNQGESSRQGQGERPSYWGGRQWGKSATAKAVMRAADEEWWEEHEAIHGRDDYEDASRDERG